MPLEFNINIQEKGDIGSHTRTIYIVNLTPTDRLLISFLFFNGQENIPLPEGMSFSVVTGILEPTEKKPFDITMSIDSSKYVASPPIAPNPIMRVFIYREEEILCTDGVTRKMWKLKDFKDYPIDYTITYPQKEFVNIWLDEAGTIPL